MKRSFRLIGILILSVLFESALLLAQSDPSFPTTSPFVEIANADAIRSLNNINPSLLSAAGQSSRCQRFNTANPTSMVACEAKESDFGNSVIVQTPEFEPGKIDPRIAEGLPPEFIEETKDKKVSCLIRFKMQNDNRQMGGCSDSSRTKNIAECGDDFGRTHSLGIGVSCSTADGISRTFDYSTDLYSKLDSSRPATPVATGGLMMGYTLTPMNSPKVRQRFISENIFSFVQDNINKGELNYWKAGVGFINLSEKKKWGLAQSTGQQQWFHNTLNKINDNTAADFTYVEGSKDKWGAFVSMSVGLQEHARIGKRCSVSLASDVGGRISTLKQSNTLVLNTDVKTSFMLTGDSSVYLRGKSEVIQRPSSLVAEETAAIGFQRKSGSFVETGITKQFGNRKDVYDSRNMLSGKNDAMIFLRVGYGFGLSGR